MAGLMALNALAIDAMVPALPAIGEALRVTDENDRQLVVSALFLRLRHHPAHLRAAVRPLRPQAGADLQPGPLCRLRPRLRASAASFTLLLAARMAQGAAAAATRVLIVSIVRDRFEGAAMARLMSLVFVVFLLMPVLAPTFGQLTLLVASWRWIFFGLSAFGAIMLVWTLIRLPETLHPEYRRPLSAADDLGRRARDADQPAVARLHPGLHPDDGRPARLYRLDPADRVRRVRPPRADRRRSSSASPGRWPPPPISTAASSSGWARGGSPISG